MCFGVPGFALTNSRTAALRSGSTLATGTWSYSKRNAMSHARTLKHIYCTYTAMLAIRAELATVADVADAGVGK